MIYLSSDEPVDRNIECFKPFNLGEEKSYETEIDKIQAACFRCFLGNSDRGHCQHRDDNGLRIIGRNACDQHLMQAMARFGEGVASDPSCRTDTNFLQIGV